jgi:alpha-glucosidase
MGFVIDGHTAGAHTVISKKTTSAHRGSFAWRLGEDDSVHNDYNQGILMCRSNQLSFKLILRVFNGSIAFRYQIPSQQQFNSGKITKELTTFVFRKALTLYQYNQESVFVPLEMDSLKRSCDLPATLTDHKKTYVSIGEADNDDYTKTELTKGDLPHSLQLSFMHDSVARTTKNYRMPWRTVSFSNTAVGLHRCSQLYLKLVQPISDSIPAWIKPGKLIRSGLSAKSAIRCIDFAAAHNFQYILFDAGWYGKEFNSISDPTTYIKGLDIPAIVKYGKSKGIGLILYVNYVGLRKYLDTIIPLYKKWGVAGMKFGFVDGLTQAGIKWLISAVRKATDAGFIIDVHDNYKPTGLSRKYPAWLTQEGIRGDEHGPDAVYTTTLPFTRFLAGPADFTFCYPNSMHSFSRNLKVSMAHQLALTVIYFSPLQSMFWYGKPEDYTNEQEIEFFKYVPTVWDESHYLKGEIGEYISVARRKGDVWFMGNAAGPESWKGSEKLNFLKANTVYQASIYEDNGKGGIRKKILQVKKGEKFPINIKAKSGQAIIMRPLRDNQEMR